MQKNTLVMIQSMTGYGKASATFGDKKINVEIKSLNSKAMDLSTRIAPLYREKEIEIRNMVSKSLERGKVDFSLWIEKEASTSAAQINIALAQSNDQLLTWWISVNKRERRSKRNSMRKSTTSNVC